MSKAEITVRVKRLQQEGILTCTACGESYRVLELSTYPEALCNNNDWCKCQQGKSVFMRRVEHAR